MLPLMLFWNIEPDWSSTRPIDGVTGIGVKLIAGQFASGPGSLLPFGLAMHWPSLVQV